jgi:hypothetical protein
MQRQLALPTSWVQRHPQKKAANLRMKRAVNTKKRIKYNM